MVTIKNDLYTEELEGQRNNLRAELQHILAEIEEIKAFCAGKQLLINEINNVKRRIEKCLEEN